MNMTKPIQTIAELAARFPAAFEIGKKRRPLRVGIHHEVIAAAPDLGVKQIKLALRWYVCGTSYLRACTEGAVRVGLDGSPYGAVTAEQAASAEMRLAAMLKRNATARSASPIGKTIAPAPPVKLSIAGLREAARARRQCQQETRP
jgi:ProP effector